MKKSILKITAISTFCMVGALASANAEKLTTEQELAYTLKALPELADQLEAPSASKSTAVKIKCYVDTPAYDNYTFNNCFNAGFARTTSAVFALDNVPSGSQVIWSNGACTANSSYCVLPIRQYQSVSVNATVLKPNGTYSAVNATAYYEGFD